jgi:hypothetical protein
LLLLLISILPPSLLLLLLLLLERISHHIWFCPHPIQNQSGQWVDLLARMILGITMAKKLAMICHQWFTLWIVGRWVMIWIDWGKNEKLESLSVVLLHWNSVWSLKYPLIWNWSYFGSIINNLNYPLIKEKFTCLQIYWTLFIYFFMQGW